MVVGGVGVNIFKIMHEILIQSIKILFLNIAKKKLNLYPRLYIATRLILSRFSTMA